MDKRRTIVLVLRSGGDFAFRDVQLIVDHILGTWQSSELPRIILLWDKASEHYQLKGFEAIPLTNSLPKTWARMMTYSPEMEQYRPFLYIDLDTAVVGSIEPLFTIAEHSSSFIPLEDFSQPRKLATGVAWFPANNNDIKRMWDEWHRTKELGWRMDYFLRKIINPKVFWQDLTKSIKDFKPARNTYLTEIPEGTTLVCFHGKPRIFESNIEWVKNYILQQFPLNVNKDPLVTVIIPYNKDRGWLQAAINSVPAEAQLILSKGDGNWPENFNKAISQAKGKYIRWLHEDDMLTPNCIADSVKAIEEQGVDFIHGNAIEISRERKRLTVYRPMILNPNIQELKQKNVLHSATMMYKREVFDKIGLMNEFLNVQEEYEFNLRCLDAGLKLGYCNSELAYYRRHDQQKVRVVSKEEKRKEKELVNNMYL